MKLDLLKTQWVEIVFEGRNKIYGAYQLRKNDKKTTYKSLVIGAIVFTFLVSLPMLANLIPKSTDKDDTLDKKIVTIKLPPKQEKPKDLNLPPPPPPPPKVSDVLNIVEDDVELDDELELMDTEANENTSVDYKAIVVEEEEEADAPVFFIVEQMPVFPGGEEALRKYIAQSVKYPAIAQENGIQGRVFVAFVVNTKGEVTDVKIARGVDPNLDKEAIRVVTNMPKWAPGKQRGKAVKVSYTVPINFVLQ